MSVCLSQTEARKEGFGKNKKSEHDENFPAEESTHYGDAGDMLVTGILESGMSYGNEARTNESMMMG